MVTVVFWHFGASIVALALRFYSRPVIRCFARCCCCCCRRAKLGVDDEKPPSLADLLGSILQLKWYWFHLAMQVGFMLREVLVISSLNGWCLEVGAAHTAIWMTILLVGCEVWRFSQIRDGSEKQKVAVDGLLDMLLLPVNIGFFCALCVRVLKLQPDSHARTMVAVLIESPEIYEAFALWSVLELFVKNVDAVAGRDPQRDAAAIASFKSFKSISLQGVKAWVLIQSAAVAFKLVLQGVIAVYMPTLCFYATHSCASCQEWYESNLAAAITSVIFILCSFAIMFVFYFEVGYRALLEDIGPMWKFLGVKGIVSVTYFQWLVISLLATFVGWGETQVYLWHCLLYAFWMPCLAIFHTLLAYPYYSPRAKHRGTLAPWLVSWLRNMRAVGDDDDIVVVGTPCGRAADADSDIIGASGACSEFASTSHDIHCVGASSSQVEAAEENPVEVSTVSEESQEPADEAGDPPERRRCCVSASVRCAVPIYCLFAVAWCCVSVRLILRSVPVMDSMVEPSPLYVLTCTGDGELANFLEHRTDLNFRLMNDSATKLTQPGVAGAWLPLCSSTPVGCQLGHYATHGVPSLSCNAHSHYTWEGTCASISCGKPPAIPHATPRVNDVVKQNWTYGVTVHYDCDKPGFRGSLRATCNITSDWIVRGRCEEVVCGSTPPNISNAEPLINHKQADENISTGMVVRYQCDPMFIGSPTATCGDDGMFIKEGRCRRECGAPPIPPHASPHFDNALAAGGWAEGMMAPYVCDAGYEGHVSAVCCADGNFTVAGHCVLHDPAPAPPSELVDEHDNVALLQAVVGLETVALCVAIAFCYWGYQPRCCRRRAAARNVALLPRAVGASSVGGRLQEVGLQGDVEDGAQHREDFQTRVAES